MKNTAIISLYSFIKGGDRYMNTILTRNNILVSLAVAMFFSLIMMVQSVAFANDINKVCTLPFVGIKDVDGGVEITHCFSSPLNGENSHNPVFPDEINGKDVVGIGKHAILD